MKAATEMLAPLVSGKCRKPFEKAARGLRRRLGPLRDLDVMLEHLDEIKDAKFQTAKAWLKYRLNEARSDAVEQARKQAPASHALAKLGSWWGLHQEIADVQDSIDEVVTKAVHLQLDAFAERATDESSGDPHALRIAGKSLRYTLEMAKAHGRRLPASVIAQFKHMQDALGLWHDYVVLTERMLCETVDCDLVLHDPQLQELILTLAQVILRKAQRHLGAMRELWRGHGEDLCRQIRQAFPLTTPVGTEKVAELEEPNPAPPEEKFPDAVSAEIPAEPASPMN
jgi:CHAD domain-containing protein